MNHGTLFLLHPEDERPFIWSGRKQYGATFFKHISDGIRTNENATMSLGIAFRVTCHSHEVWKKSGALVLKKEFFPNDHQEYIYGICDAMLQEYVANTEQKCSDEAKIENWWKICDDNIFNSNGYISGLLKAMSYSVISPVGGFLQYNHQLLLPGTDITPSHEFMVHHLFQCGIL